MGTDFLTGWWLLILPVMTGSDYLAMDVRKAGIEPSKAGMVKFLESLRLTPEREAKIRALLVDLGSERFRVRDKATAELLTLPYVPHSLLKEASEKSLETKRRVENIQSRSKFAEFESRSLTAARFIENRRIKGLSPLLLELMPQWQDEYLLQAASRAVAASAERKDVDALRAALARDRISHVRSASAAALATALGRDAEKELIILLDDADPRVALAAATSLLNQGNRKALAVLIRLLDAETFEIRQGAATVLRAATGQHLGYVGYDDAKQRAESIAAWRIWLAKEGATAKLDLPIRPRRVMIGRIVIADYGRRLVHDVEASTFKTVFQGAGGAFNYPWAAHGTQEGHCLIADWTGRYVVEYDRQGKECWRQNVPGQPTGVERLPNGRTLLALAEPGEVVEIDRSGQVVWKVTLAGRPTTAQRLDNGNTVVCLQYAKKIVEIDPKGNVVWQLTEGMVTPHTVQGLENGNVLVCDFGNNSVTEFTRNGKVVWVRQNIRNPAQAQRLPNGNTLICSEEGLQEFDGRGTLVRQFQVARSKFFAY